MNGASEKFDVKMIVLKHVHRESALSRFEFIADDEEQTLADLVVPSLRPEFKLTEDKRHVLEIKDGQLALFKILKSLKLYEWKLLTSNAFSLPGTSGSVETVFYYEKSIGNSSTHVGGSAAPVPAASSVPAVAAVPAASVASMASRYTMNLKRTVPTNHTDAAHPPHAENVGGKSGVEEEKSASSYTQKPLPNVPVRHFGTTPISATNAASHTLSHSESHNASHHVYHSEAAHNNYHGSNPITEHHTASASTTQSQSQAQSQAPSSTHSHGQSIAEADMAMKRVSTNREKLLQKYNQHRRLSTGKADAPTSPSRPTSTTTAASWIKPAITVSTAAPGVVSASAPAAAVSSTPLSQAHATPSSSSQGAHVVHAAHSVHSAAATFASTPPPTPLTSMPPAAPASATATAAATVSPTADAPRVNAASAYPSLVRRVSSAKGFVQTSSANNSTNNMTLNTRTSSVENVNVTTTAGSAVDDVAPTNHAVSGEHTHTHSGDHHSHSSSHSYSVSKTTYTSSTTVVTEDHGGIHARESTVSRPSSFTLKNHIVPAPPSAPLPSTTEVPVAAEPVKSAPVVASAAPEVPIENVETAKKEEEGEPGDEPALRIASHNPLTAPVSTTTFLLL